MAGEKTVTGAREEILGRIRRSRGPVRAQSPVRYEPSSIVEPESTFIAKAAASYAEMHEIGERDSVPETILAVFSRAGAEPRLHVPKGSPLWTLPWHRAPRLELTDATPGMDDTALSAADYAIAETGTLAFQSGPARPASWHFLPAREFVLVSRANILATLEHVAAAVAAKGLMPSTLNLVTGPSRTADIEQVLELGAHGPREIHILLAR
jgi:L-lactate dehydrogenase complex protein LldG